MSKKPSRSKVRKRGGVARWWPLAVVAAGLVLVGAAIRASIRPPGVPDFTPEYTGGPQLKPDRENVNLGDVRLGETVSVSFELTNVGDRPLRFTQPPFIEVAAGC